MSLYQLVLPALALLSPSVAITSGPDFIGGINATTANLPYGSFLGSISDTYPLSLKFLGVPYATPPLYDLRFRAPVALDTNSSTSQFLNVTTYPEPCIQGTTGSGDAGGAGSEDCLKVNIYTPVNVTSNSKCYVYGNPANWPFDHWIQQSPNVVIVSVYYRLDAFGLLSYPSFTSPASDFQSVRSETSLGDLNAGFLDQITALRWIKSYIIFFGGDPDKVTINGESAGGSSVELHLVAETSPLFEFFASSAGCGTGDLASQMTCLRNATVSALARAQDNFTSSNFTGHYDAFHPVVDSALTDYPTRLIDQGNFRHVPLIVGATTNETLSGGTNITSALDAYFPSLSNATLSGFLQEYPSSAFPTEDLRFQTATGDAELRCARTIIGSASSKFTSKTFTYRYNTANPTSSDTSLVSHAAENWMMFLGTNTGFNGTTTFTTQNSTEKAFASELIAYWLSFVRSGDPNTFKLSRSPEWSEYSASDRQRLILTQGPDPASDGTAFMSGSKSEIEGKTETGRCEFIASKAGEEQA